jgi:hypothetical protein
MTPIRDGEWTLFEHDPATGRSVWWMVDEDGVSVFRIDTPVDQVLEANAEAMKASDGKPFGEWARVASVPLQLLHSSGLNEAQTQGDDKWLSRWLNDSDNRAFRTKAGIV